MFSAIKLQESAINCNLVGPYPSHIAVTTDRPHGFDARAGCSDFNNFRKVIVYTAFPVRLTKKKIL